MSANPKTLNVEKTDSVGISQSSDMEESRSFYDYPKRDLEDIQVYLDRLEEIIELGAFDRAICAAAFILEAILPAIAKAHHVDFETQTPLVLLQNLSERGLIEADFYPILRRVSLERDRILNQQASIIVEVDFASQVFDILHAVFQSIKS